MRRFIATCLALALLVLGLLLGATGCKKNEAPPDTVPTTVAAPDGLLCEGIARSPDGTWKNVQQGVAGLATLLPSSAFGVLAVSGGLEVGLGDLVDGTRPAVFVAAGNVLTPQWVLVASAKEKRAVEAKFPSRGSSRLVAPSTVSLERIPVQGTLTAQQAAPPFTVYLSSRGDLVIARDEASADLLAPYALFTVQPGVAKAEPHDLSLRVPEAAMPALANVLRLKWTEIELKLVQQDAADRKLHGGRAPDFGDPAALVAAANAAITRTTGMLADAAEVTVVFDATKDGTTLEVRAPSKGGPIAALVDGFSEGGGEPLATEPMSTRLAWLGYGTPASRADNASAVAGVVRDMFKDRIPAASVDQLTRAVVAFGEKAGSAVRVRLESEPLRATVLTAPAEANLAPFRQSVTDGASVLAREAKLRELLRLTKVEGPAKMKAGQGNTDSSPPERTLLTSVGSSLALYGREKGGAVAFALERAPKLDLLADLPGDAPWLQSTRPELARMLTDLGARSVFVLLSGVAQAKSAEEPAALVLGAGKRESEGKKLLSVRVVAPYRFARELPRLAIPNIFGD